MSGPKPACEVTQERRCKEGSTKFLGLVEKLLSEFIVFDDDSSLQDFIVEPRH